MFVCDTLNYSDISRVALRPSESVMSFIKVNITAKSLHILLVKNQQNEICQTNFHTAFLSRLRSLTRHIISFGLVMRSCYLGNNTKKYV